MSYLQFIWLVIFDGSAYVVSACDYGEIDFYL